MSGLVSRTFQPFGKMKTAGHQYALVVIYICIYCEKKTYDTILKSHYELYSFYGLSTIIEKSKRFAI